jgi:Protein of unknown function (DUF2568)
MNHLHRGSNEAVTPPHALLRSANLAVRFLLELGAVAGLAYWGTRAGSTTLTRVVLALGAPLCLAMLWGAFCAPRPWASLPGRLREAGGLALLCLSALALGVAGQPAIAIAFAAVAIINALLLVVL